MRTVLKPSRRWTRLAWLAGGILVLGLALVLPLTLLVGPGPRSGTGRPRFHQPSVAPGTAAPGAAHPAARPAPRVWGTLDQWRLVYADDFTNLSGVHIDQSSPLANASLRSGDATNASLQLPSVSRDVRIVSDPQASDHRALEVLTTRGLYRSAGRTVPGWVNGRMQLSGYEAAPPLAISARLRFTPSVQTKGAVMWWPARKGWPWEVDLAETFGGGPGSPWANRRLITENWHHALHGSKGAVPFIRFEQRHLDAARYHVYTLYITAREMWETVDGTLVGVAGPPWLPSGRGYFGIGTALTGLRAGPHTRGAVLVDWVRIYRPRSGHLTLPPLRSPLWRGGPAYSAPALPKG